jgi:hypothetical protein
MTPMEQMLQQVGWTATSQTSSQGDLPYATHHGVMDLFGHKLRVYRLNDGRAIINAEDLHKFFGFDDEGKTTP